MTLSLAVAALSVALLVSVAALIVGDYRLVTALRRDHPRVWETLRQPSPWFTRFEDVSAVHQFLHQRAYASLDDEALIRLADRLRALTIVTCLLTVILLALATVGRRLV